MIVVVASGIKSCERDSEWSVCDKRETDVEVEQLVTKDSWKHSRPLHALPAVVSAWRHFVTGPNLPPSPFHVVFSLSRITTGSFLLPGLGAYSNIQIVFIKPCRRSFVLDP